MLAFATLMPPRCRYAAAPSYALHAACFHASYARFRRLPPHATRLLSLHATRHAADVYFAAADAMIDIDAATPIFSPPCRRFFAAAFLMMPLMLP